MNGRDDSVYLRHILDAIARIEQYLQDIDEEQFMNYPLIQDGVIRQLEIVGEAVKQVSFELRDQYPHVPWKDIAGMRDKLIHQYFGVDLEAVWTTVTEDVPVLEQEVEHILSHLEHGSRA